MQIGQRNAQGLIWSGEHYGFQSPQSFIKLKSEGAFKTGAKEVRSLKSIASRLYDQHAPQQLKDAVTWYSQGEQRAQKRLLDRGFTQKQIDERNAIKQKYSKDSGDATTKLLKDVSDATNIAPEIVNAGAFLLETAAEGISGRAMARSSLRGLSRAPAPVALASGKLPPTSTLKDRRLRDAISGARNINQPDLPQGRFPGGSTAALQRDTKVRTGIQQKLEDIKSGKAIPARSSVIKATDKLAVEKATAAARNSTTRNRVTGADVPRTKSKFSNPDEDTFGRSKEGTKLHGVTQGDVNRVVDPVDQAISSRGVGFDGAPGVPTNGAAIRPGGVGNPPPAKPLPTWKNKRLQEKVAKLKRQRTLRNNRNRDDFFSGEGTASTFSSKKGAGKSGPNRTGAFDESEGFNGAYDGLYDSDSGLFGDNVIDAERKGRKGQPGQRIPLETNIKIQVLEERTGMRLAGLPGPERKERIMNYLRDKEGIDVRKLDQKSQDQYLTDFIKRNTLEETSSRARAKDYIEEKANPEQFNQIEAAPNTVIDRTRKTSSGHPKRSPNGKPIKDRVRDADPINYGPEGISSNTPPRSKTNRAGRKTRGRSEQKSYVQLDANGNEIKVLSGKVEAKRLRAQGVNVREVIDPDRNYVLGNYGKSRQRQYGNLADRSDNIQGGRNIPQSEATIRQRLEQTASRKRARDMVTFNGKRNLNQILKNDKQRRKEGRGSALPGHPDQWSTKKPKVSQEIKDKIQSVDDGRAAWRELNTFNESRTMRQARELPNDSPEFRNNRMQGQSTNQDVDPRLFSSNDLRRADGKSRLPDEVVERINVLTDDLSNAKSRKQKKAAKKELEKYLRKQGLEPKLAEQLFLENKAAKQPFEPTERWGRVGPANPNNPPELPSGSGGVTPANPKNLKTPKQRRGIRERLEDTKKLGKKKLNNEATDLIKADQDKNPDDYRVYGRNTSRTTDDQGFSRDVTADDSIYNSNPFTKSGELRGTQTVSDKEYLGVNEVKVTGRDPAQGGRSKGSSRQSIADKLQELRDTAEGKNLTAKKDGTPTLKSLKRQAEAVKELKRMEAEKLALRTKRAKRSESFVERMKRIRNGR